MEEEKVDTIATPDALIQSPRTESTEVAGSEHRQVYGTAKTENLRDSGLWRILLPAVVVLGSVALLAIPLIILIPLLIGSLSPDAAANKMGLSLTWIWLVMIVIEVVLAVVAIRGLLKIFITQAGNY
jgi:hypothetical protein